VFDLVGLDCRAARRELLLTEEEPLVEDLGSDDGVGVPGGVLAGCGVLGGVKLSE
jgi:hypothetical protein